mgnify:CR=1 FL=1
MNDHTNLTTHRIRSSTRFHIDAEHETLARLSCSLAITYIMNVKLSTQVKGNYIDVMKAFDRKLFEALKPSVGKMEIVEFTGSKKGDRVHMQFFSPIKAEWVSDIVEDSVDARRAIFIDEGVVLPWPLASWRHKHIVQKIDEDSSYIIDDITFEGSNFLLSWILYPAIYFGFYPRKKIYKSFFQKSSTNPN